MGSTDPQRPREDEGPTEGGSGATDWRALVVEVARTLRSEWRAVLLAIILSLLGYTVTRLLGSDSDVAVVSAIVLGAALAVWLTALAERFRWRERTLAAIAGVLALLNLDKPRTWLAQRIGPSQPADGSALSGVTASVVAAVGAGVGLAVAGVTGAFSPDAGTTPGQPIPSPSQLSRSAACEHGAEGVANTLRRRSSAYRRFPTALPVIDQICPDFDGDNLRDIAFTFAGGSGGAGVWAAFRARPGGRWQKVYESPGGLGLLISWRRPAIYIRGANAGCPWKDSPCKFVWRDGTLRATR
jgi:hypothetical protein